MPELISFLKQENYRVIGYNNKGFDDYFLNYIIANEEYLSTADSYMITRDLKELSNLVIAAHSKSQTSFSKKAKFQIRKYKTRTYDSIDVLNMFNTVDRVSLKHLAIKMNWHNIIDLPYAHTTVLTKEQCDNVLAYQDNDVNITEHALTKYLAERFNFRVKTSKKYNIDLRDSNDTTIAKKVLAKFYSRETRKEEMEFTGLRTHYAKINLSSCLSDKIRFSTKIYQDMLKAVSKKTIDVVHKEDKKKSNKKQFEYILKTKAMTHTIALGGIHSNNSGQIIQEEKGFMLLDMDVTSFYPFLFINEKLFPAHLGPALYKVYKKYVVDARVDAKRSGDMLEAEVLKIVANSTYGLTKSKYSWLYDPRVATYICITGQMYQCMLMEAIEKHTSAKVVYSNTDGITVKLLESEYFNVMKVCKHWQEYTGLQLEFVRFKKMVIENVNSFLIETHKTGKDRLKQKGNFLQNRPLVKGLAFPIIAKALNEYYLNGKAPEYTVSYEQDARLFQKAQRTKDTFEVYAYYDSKRIKLQKNNRWVVTNGNPEECKLLVEDKEKGTATQLQKGYRCTVVNKWVDKTPDEYKINYSFYVNEVYKIINSINKTDHDFKHAEYEQATLF